MLVDILYFAVLRERIGRDQEKWTLPAGADVRAARAAVAARYPSIEGLLARVQTAVNRAIVDEGHPLREGDEVALLPPVAGGAGARKIALVDAPLDLDEARAAVTDARDDGGVVTFLGIVRRRGHHLPDVVRLEYEAYVEMAEQVLADIATEIEQEWPGTAVAIHHRLGALGVGEIAVAIVAASAHRAPAFAACQAAIDRLKLRAPIWKKEVGESGEAWLGLGA